MSESILITGASSGIGEALALAYARPNVKLFLCGRDKARLQAVAQLCRTAGAEVFHKTQCVTQPEEMAAWIQRIAQEDGLDLVIANAGISAGTGEADGESAQQARDIFSVNLGGVMNTVLPAIEIMTAKRSGQIAIISSLAGFVGLAGAPAYCASKAAVRVWGEGLRAWLAPYGVKVCVVCPGFVTSRMTARNAFPMPFLMSADEAARRIKTGLARNKGRIVFPIGLWLPVWLMTVLPIGWIESLSRLLPRKT